MIGKKYGTNMGQLWDNYETYETCEIYKTNMGHMRHASFNSPKEKGIKAPIDLPFRKASRSQGHRSG